MLVQTIDSNLPRGVVASQSPAPGASAPLGSTVTVYLSTGHAAKTRVPNVVGFSEAEATRTLLDRGYRVSVFYQQVNNAKYDNRVLGQNPTGGTVAQQGTTVTIVVGRHKP
jgi:serine/threonine-protein kinase